MIVRVVTIHMQPGQEGLFHASLRREIQELRAQPGLVYVKVARRLLPSGGEEVVLMEEWATVHALHAWAGADLARPRFLPDVENQLADAARWVGVAHYEAIDLEMADDATVVHGLGAATSTATAPVSGSESWPGADARRGPGPTLR
jgi:heme-degrading monooxygenase HmoA